MDYIHWTLCTIIQWLILCNGNDGFISLTVAFFAETTMQPSLILKSAVACITTDEIVGGNSKYLTYIKIVTRVCVGEDCVSVCTVPLVNLLKFPTALLNQVWRKRSFTVYQSHMTSCRYTCTYPIMSPPHSSPQWSPLPPPTLTHCREYAQLCTGKSCVYVWLGINVRSSVVIQATAVSWLHCWHEFLQRKLQWAI